MKLLLLVAIVSFAGCSDSRPVTLLPMEAQFVAHECCAAAGRDRLPHASLLDAHRSGGHEALRASVDAKRNRLWVLGLERVYVYDIAKARLIQSIALPDWSVAEGDFVCQPDLALDRSGTAFISHNMEPRLWQIDADSFQLTEHAIRLVGRERWDVGFGGLEFALDGTLFGVTALASSLWRIDVGNASAHQVEIGAPLPDGCAKRPLRIMPS